MPNIRNGDLETDPTQRAGTLQSDRNNEFGNRDNILRTHLGHLTISDLLEFVIIKSILKNYYHIESCFELSSDYSPIIIVINKYCNKLITKSKLCTFHNTKTNWTYF